MASKRVTLRHASARCCRRHRHGGDSPSPPVQTPPISPVMRTRGELRYVASQFAPRAHTLRWLIMITRDAVSIMRLTSRRR